MSNAGGISPPAYHPVRIVISKQNRSSGIGRIDRIGKGAIAITEIAVS